MQKQFIAYTISTESCFFKSFADETPSSHLVTLWKGKACPQISGASGFGPTFDRALPL